MLHLRPARVTHCQNYLKKIIKARDWCSKLKSSVRIFLKQPKIGCLLSPLVFTVYPSLWWCDSIGFNWKLSKKNGQVWIVTKKIMIFSFSKPMSAAHNLCTHWAIMSEWISVIVKMLHRPSQNKHVSKYVFGQIYFAISECNMFVHIKRRYEQNKIVGQEKQKRDFSDPVNLVILFIYINESLTLCPKY